MACQFMSKIFKTQWNLTKFAKRNYMFAPSSRLKSYWNKGALQLPVKAQQHVCLIHDSLNHICLMRTVQYSSDSSDSSDSDSDSEVEQSLKQDPELHQLIQDLKSDFVDKKIESDTFGDNECLEDTTESDDKYKAYYKIQEQILEAELQNQFAEEHEQYVYEPEPKDIPVPITRGQFGVYDINEVVKILKSDNAMDLCVLKVPDLLNYVDYLVLVTGKSFRHIKAMAENIKWIYKRKRGKGDAASVRVEGLQSRDWLAMDMGNIAVHLFLEETREKYDLETLWSVGAEFDEDLLEEENPLTALLSDEYFKGLDLNNLTFQNTSDNQITKDEDKTRHIKSWHQTQQLP